MEENFRMGDHNQNSSSQIFDSDQDEPESRVKPLINEMTQQSISEFC